MCQMPSQLGLHRRERRATPYARRGGTDPAYALRRVTKLYRTTPLRGLWHPPQLKGPYFHDGSAPTLAAAVDHYVQLFGLSLTSQQKADLVEYLKTL